MDHLAQILLLLVVATTVVVLFQRLQVPTSLAYLLVGLILGPYTLGPTISMPGLEALAEFGVVFLLFTIGLNFSLPQLRALRHQVLGLGTGQVVFTTALVAVVAFSLGAPPAAAFVLGAVFAQSSTTIMASLLTERGEENTQHGRLGLAMSVFQDVTAVPFLVVIPVLGASVALEVLAGALSMAMLKALLAIVVVFMAGRWLLQPLLRLVAERRSVEVFTLAVLLVALLAAWSTNALGLSLAFGAFLAGMMLGDTEFRHQVEATVRPFRDVLLGLFFIGVGMRFDPLAVVPIWSWVVAGAALIVVSKIIVVGFLVRRSGVDLQVALRSALLLSVGGEFGLALVAIALDARVLDDTLGQVAMSSVLLAMVVGAVLIRFNGVLVHRLLRSRLAAAADPAEPLGEAERTVVIAGYGRVGHAIAVVLQASSVPFVAIDPDPKKVAQGRSDGFPVLYGDITDLDFLTAIHADRASLVVITIDRADMALKAMNLLRRLCPQVPVVARARDLQASAALLHAGALHAYPETIEASLHLGATALRLLHVDDVEIEQVIQGVRDRGYRPVLDSPPASSHGSDVT